MPTPEVATEDRLLKKTFPGMGRTQRRCSSALADWVRATLVEALFGLGQAAKSEAEFAIAKKSAPEPWMINVMEEQLAKVLLRSPDRQSGGPIRGWTPVELLSRREGLRKHRDQA
jgi:hypothetical protein